MKTSRFIACLAWIIIWSSVKPSSAALVLSFAVSTPEVMLNPAGQASVLVSIQAAANTGTQTLKAYDLFVDVAAPAGTGLPSGWTLNTPVSVANLSGGAFFSPSTTPSQGDVRAGDVNLVGAITLTTAPITLWQFDANIDASSGAVDGIYSLDFLTGGNFSLKDANNLDVDFTANSRGISVTVSAVPEPSSALLLMAIGLTGTYRVRRRVMRH